MKPEQEQVRNLLTDTVSLLCKNSLFYNDELRVEGVIGVTLDNNDVFIIHINEKFGGTPDSEVSKREKSGQSTSKQDSSKKFKPDHEDSYGTNAPNSRSSSNRSTPSGPSHSSVQASPSRVKVKCEMEDDDDDLMIVEKSEPGVRSQCRMQTSKASNREQRVPPLHGPPGPAEMEAMRAYPNYNQYAGQNQNVGQLRNTQTGEPAAKRRVSDAGGGTFITGMVPNLHQGSTDSSTAWAVGTGIPPDLAAQLSQPDGPVSLDQLTPGSSQPAISSQGGLDQMSTPGGRRAMQPQAPSAEWIAQICGTFRTRQSKRVDGQPVYQCTHPNCGRSFLHPGNLWRHEVKQHGKKKKRTWKNTSPSYEQWMMSQSSNQTANTTGGVASEGAPQQMMPPRQQMEWLAAQQQRLAVQRGSSVQQQEKSALPQQQRSQTSEDQSASAMHHNQTITNQFTSRAGKTVSAGSTRMRNPPQSSVLQQGQSSLENIEVKKEQEDSDEQNPGIYGAPITRTLARMNSPSDSLQGADSQSDLIDPRRVGPVSEGPDLIAITPVPYKMETGSEDSESRHLYPEDLEPLEYRSDTSEDSNDIPYTSQA